MKYRKKPVVIEAFQYSDDMGSHTSVIPVWFTKACLSGVVRSNPDGKTFIKTLEGLMEVSSGDWIIKGIKDELYPCKPEIFAATYEPVAEAGV